MTFEIPDAATISASLTSLHCSIQSFESARIFLQSYGDITSPSIKNPANRVISWLLAFRVINSPPDRWPSDLVNLATDYSQKLNNHFSESPDDPLSTVVPEFSNFLKKDLTRILSWFNIIIKDVGLQPEDVPNALHRLSRIYSVIILNVPDVSYMQGLDRYGVVCLMAAVVFTKNGNLPIDFAEALAYYFTKATLTMIPFLKTFRQQAAIRSHFSKVDEILKAVDPQKHRIMVENGSSTVYFGCRWEMLLFADEHSGNEILDLWDQIFGRLEKIGQFVQCLTIAHMLQVSIPEDCLSVNEAVLHWRQWNIEKMTKDALNVMGHKKTPSQKCCAFSCPCCHQFQGFEVLSDI